MDAARLGLQERAGDALQEIAHPERVPGLRVLPPIEGAQRLQDALPLERLERAREAVLDHDPALRGHRGHQVGEEVGLGDADGHELAAAGATPRAAGHGLSGGGHATRHRLDHCILDRLEEGHQVRDGDRRRGQLGPRLDGRLGDP
jgi:hypothetical protein